MIMRYVVFVLVLALSVMLDCAFFPSLDAFGLIPDVTLFAVISFSLLQNTQIGLYFGVAAGVLKAIYASFPIGISFAIYIAPVVICGLAKKRVSVDNIFIPAILTLFMFVLRDLMLGVYMFLINNPFGFFRVTTASTIPRALFTAALALALYWPIMRLNKKRFMVSVRGHELF